MRAVSNTSPLLNLAIIDQLQLIPRQFERVSIPRAVLDELQVDEDRPGSSALRKALSDGWLALQDVDDAPLVTTLRLELDAGEAEAIALALDLGCKHVLMDEAEGRSRARALGLIPTGVVGVLLRAQRAGDVPGVASLLSRLREEAGFYLRDDFVQRILAETGEVP